MASRTARKGTSRYKIRNWKQYEAGLIQREASVFGLTMMQLINGILKQKIKHEEDKKNTGTLQYRFV